MKVGKTLVLFICSVTQFFETLADNSIVVTLPGGQIRGHELRSANDNVYYAFQEIPYAAPPVGQLRFKAPTAPEPWDGILNTTQNTKVCYQSGTAQEIPNATETEDCLYLNVYTPLKPNDTSATPLPVLVWIHGGAFQNGAGVFQTYTPKLFIDYNVLIVTINYRVGPLGFLTTEDGVIPGNIGLKDQHFAIQWVKKNINLFGGDSEKIVISGESAGSASVGLQLLIQQNKGLFNGAILHSGTSLCQWAHQNYARYYAFELGRTLSSDFTSDDSTALLKLLQSLPASDIAKNNITVEIGKEAGVVEADGLIWLPVIEDEGLEGAVLTGLFHEDIRTGNIVQVPTLIGFSSEEILMFTSQDPSLPERAAKYFDSDESNLIGNRFNMTRKNKLTAGKRLEEIYTNETFETDLGPMVKFLSDERFTTPIIRHAKLQSNYSDLYLYQFSYKGKMGGFLGVESEGVTGVAHAEILSYIWDRRIIDDSPDDPEDLKTRQRLLTLWTNFVKYLNPTPEKDSFLDNIVWDKVTPNRLVYLNINNTLEMQQNPKEYLQWERIIDIYAIPPLVNY